MSWGDYKPHKEAWVNGGFGEETVRGQPVVGWDRQADLIEAELCAQLMQGCGNGCMT